MFEIEIGNRVKIRKGKPTQKTQNPSPTQQPKPTSVSPFLLPHGPSTLAQPVLPHRPRGPVLSPRPSFSPVAQPSASASLSHGPLHRAPAPPRPASRRSPRRSLSHCAPGPPASFVPSASHSCKRPAATSARDSRDLPRGHAHRDPRPSLLKRALALSRTPSTHAQPNQTLAAAPLCSATPSPCAAVG